MNHPPTSICSGTGEDDPSKTRLLVQDPSSGRGFVASTDQTTMSRPEFLFLEVPCHQGTDTMIDCCRLITKYANEGTLPADLEPVSAEEGLHFTALVVAAGTRTCQALQQYYFHKECTHGAIVMVPRKEMVPWGCDAGTEEAVTK